MPPATERLGSLPQRGSLCQPKVQAAQSAEALGNRFHPSPKAPKGWASCEIPFRGRDKFAPAELASAERRFGNQKEHQLNSRHRWACPAGAMFINQKNCKVQSRLPAGLPPPEPYLYFRQRGVLSNIAPPGQAGRWRVKRRGERFWFPNFAPAGRARRWRGDPSRGSRGRTWIAGRTPAMASGGRESLAAGRFPYGCSLALMTPDPRPSASTKDRGHRVFGENTLAT